MDHSRIEHIINSIISPEALLAESYGEVTKAEGISADSRKPVPGGLLCETIFGPVRDYECHCGKYRSRRFAGLVCEQCHVELTQSSVRKARVGHIVLAAPAARRDCLETEALLLDLDPDALDRVICCTDYIVTDPGSAEACGAYYKQVMDEETYRTLRENDPAVCFTAMTGAAAVETLLHDLSSETSDGTLLQKEYARVKEERRTADEERAAYLDSRLDVMDAFLHSDKRPEWMILHILLVSPAGLRPEETTEEMQLDPDDINYRYMAVIIANRRLKRLALVRHSRLILYNEQRIFQERVDSLLESAGEFCFSWQSEPDE